MLAKGLFIIYLAWPAIFINFISNGAVLGSLCYMPLPICDVCFYAISLCQHCEIAHAANKHSQNYLTDFEWQIEKFSSPKMRSFRSKLKATFMWCGKNLCCIPLTLHTSASPFPFFCLCLISPLSLSHYNNSPVKMNLKQFPQMNEHAHRNNPNITIANGQIKLAFHFSYLCIKWIFGMQFHYTPAQNFRSTSVRPGRNFATFRFLCQKIYSKPFNNNRKHYSTFVMHIFIRKSFSVSARFCLICLKMFVGIHI